MKSAMLSVVVTVALVLVMGAAVLAEQEAEINVSAEIGPYAEVWAQRLTYDAGEGCWMYWSEEEPGMNLGVYNGQPGYSKVADSNAFIVESNTSLVLEFSGTPLTHTENPDSTLLTTYWALKSKGYDEEVWGTFVFPDQLVPAEPIGFFGDGEAPPFNPMTFEFPAWEDSLFYWLGAAVSWPDTWPTPGHSYGTISFSEIDGPGFYAFQVFGFAGTKDAISAQQAGDYHGEISLTVAAYN